MGLSRPCGAESAEEFAGIPARAVGCAAYKKLEDHIKRVLAQAPPVTSEQRAKLAELLRPVRILDPPNV
ncbi:MAG TPA: hypothetical protein VKI00_30695 [Mycobacterium sp.]|uniref:hypothetical protein n=1 Tax=Mycobacterium sp. TaxID=1785 RepID=UPI002C0952B1|nr:hypothetical protein [Mycobacterium sp.]HME79873.1 hypothetical protein [Mycobacterium sp.]